MKKLASVLLSFVLVLTLATGVSAKSNSTTALPIKAVTLDGEAIKSPTFNILMVEDVEYVPLRTALEVYDYDVRWYKPTQVATASKYSHTYSFEVGNLVATHNNEEIELIDVPMLVDDRLHISLTDLYFIFSITLTYDDETKTIDFSQETSEGFFWKVEKDGTVVYLLGSIHVGGDHMYPLRDEIEKAYYISDYLVLEVDILTMPEDEVLEKLEALQTYTDGTTLKNHISAETYSRLQTFLEEIELPVDSYDKFRPWAIGLDLNTYITMMNGYMSELGIDLYFALQAIDEGKHIKELESYLIQFNSLSSYSDASQEKQLNDYLDIIYGLADEEVESYGVESLANLWVTGDDEQLEQLVKEFKKDEEAYKYMILERHDRMIEQIESYLNNPNQDTHFVIAGYLHMLGEDGLVTRLKEKGYSVTRQ